MIIKRYLAKNVNEAMTRIRYELGKDAIIISQRKVRKPGFFGMFSGKMVEVTAAVESAETEKKKVEPVKKNTVNDEDEFKKSLESIKKLMENEFQPNVKNEVNTSVLNDMIMEHNANVEKEKENKIKEELASKRDINEAAGSFINKLDEKVSVEAVQKEVEELKELIHKVIENKEEAGSEQIAVESVQEVNDKSVDEIKKKLIDLDIDEEYYGEIIKSLGDYPDELDIDEKLRDIFERDILVTNQGLRGRVVLIGPTGVGKTTTIAKLAGRLALVEKKNVGLITIDTYRIGAIEQLKTYAEIMNIPFKVVITIKEMEEAIESMKDCEVVLIDTTGRSSKNTMQISELRAFVQKAEPDYINMVISATTKNRDIRSILKGYSELGYDNVIITKLDETTVYGSIYNISRCANKPINFITIGQNVPDDIKISTKDELTRFVLGEETLC